MSAISFLWSVLEMWSPLMSVCFMVERWFCICGYVPLIFSRTPFSKCFFLMSLWPQGICYSHRRSKRLISLFLFVDFIRCFWLLILNMSTYCWLCTSLLTSYIYEGGRYSFENCISWGKGNMPTSVLLEMFPFTAHQFSCISCHRFSQMLMWVITSCVKVGSDVLEGCAAGVDCNGYCSNWEEDSGWLCGWVRFRRFSLVRTTEKMDV
jgi:hypothetical protein